MAAQSSKDLEFNNGKYFIIIYFNLSILRHS